MADVPITVLSGPTVLIEYAGLRLLTDPTFDEPGDYEMSGLPIRKTTAPPTTPADLGHLDAVLLSHDEHLDNLDRSGRDLLSRVPTTLTTTSAAGRLGGSAHGLAPWEEHTLHSADGTAVTVTAVPARHGPEGSEPYTGDVTGFVLSAPGHPLVHVSGDNASMDAVREVAEVTNLGPRETGASQTLFVRGDQLPGRRRAVAEERGEPGVDAAGGFYGELLADNGSNERPVGVVRAPAATLLEAQRPDATDEVLHHRVAAPCKVQHPGVLRRVDGVSGRRRAWRPGSSSPGSTSGRT